MKVQRRIEVAARPEALYDVVMDPYRLEDWVTIHKRLEGPAPMRLRKGAKLTQCLRLAGQTFKVRWTVVENDPCKRVVWEGHGPVGSRAKVEYGFRDTGEGTDFSYLNEYDLPGGPLGRLAGRAVEKVTARELDGSLAKLRTLVE